MLGLNIGDDGTFGHGSDGHDVSDSKGSYRQKIINIKVELIALRLTFEASIDEHASVHAFDSDEILNALLVFVLVSEDDLGERSTSTGVVDNVSHDTLDVTKMKVLGTSHEGAFAASTGQLFAVSAFAASLLTQLFQRSRGF